MDTTSIDHETILSLSHDVCGNSLVEWSDDCALAIATKSCVYVLDLQCKFNDVSEDPVFYKASIPVNKDLLVLDVQVYKHTLIPTIEDINIYKPAEEKTRLMLDTTLSPLIRNTLPPTGYTQVRWSPYRCSDANGRCVLACLSIDHRLTLWIFDSKPNKWNKLCDLSMMLYEKVKENNFTYPTLQSSNNSVKDRNYSADFNTFQTRTYMLKATAIGWSGLINSKGQGASVNGETILFGLDSKDFVLLAVAMRSGTVILWKLELPVTDSSKKEVCHVFGTGLEKINAVSFQLQTGLLAVGSGEGVVSLWSVEIDASDQAVSAKFLTHLWEEKDLLRVTSLKWDKNLIVKREPEFYLLAASKGSYLVVFIIKFNEREFTLIGKSHIKVHSITISDFDFKSPRLISYDTEGFFRNTLVKVSHKGDIFLKCEDTENPEDSKKDTCNIHGFSLSPYGVYSAYLKRKEHRSSHFCLKLGIKPAWSKGDVEQLFLKPIFENGFLPPKHDVLESIRQSVMNSWPLDHGLQEIALGNGSTTSTGGKNTQTLKIRYLILMMKHSQLKSEISNQSNKIEEYDIESKTKELENLYEALCATRKSLYELHVMSSLDNFLHLNGNIETEQDSISLRAMVFYLEELQRKGKEVAAGCLSEIKTRLEGALPGQQSVETCRLCQTNIEFNDFQWGACVNGHRWDRCCLSLTCCQWLPYRRCFSCQSSAKLPSVKDSEWMKLLLSSNCILCNGKFA